MKILIYNQKDAFDRYNNIIKKLERMNSIVQNNMVIEKEETSNFLHDFNENIDSLIAWKNELVNILHSNMISDEEGEKLSIEMQENNGILISKI